MNALIRIASFAAVLAAAAPAHAAVNLITNGTFDTPNYGSGNWGDSASGVSGWYNATDSIEIGSSSVYGLSCISTGCQNLEVNANQSPTVVTQTLTGLTPGQTYVVSFDYGVRNNADLSTVLTTSFAGASVTNSTAVDGSGWTLTTFDAVATSTSETLSFYGVTDPCVGTCGNEVTNVSVSAVPEISTWAMMLLGFAGVGFAGYRRTTNRLSGTAAA
jgi:hypothetical protein